MKEVINMHSIRPALMGMLIAAMALAAPHSEAKRLGAKSSSAAASSGSAVKLEPKVGPEAGASSALRYGAAAAVGGAAGHATAKAFMDSDKEAPDQVKADADQEAVAEQKRLEKLTDLERKARAEEIARKTEQILKDTDMRKKIDLAAKQAEEKRREDDANAKRAEAEEQRAEMKRQALARELSCVIKPVMTDEEIKHCKWAWSSAQP